MRKRAKIDMRHPYSGAVTHTLVDGLRRRMRGYEAKVMAEKKLRDKANRVKK